MINLERRLDYWMALTAENVLDAIEDALRFFIRRCDHLRASYLNGKYPCSGQSWPRRHEADGGQEVLDDAV